MQLTATSFSNRLKFEVETLISCAISVADCEAQFAEPARDGKRRRHVLDDGAMVDFPLDETCDEETRAELEIEELPGGEEGDALADALLELEGASSDHASAMADGPPRPASPRRKPAHTRRGPRVAVRQPDYFVRVFRDEEEPLRSHDTD